MEKQNNFSQEIWFREYQAQTEARLARNLAHMQRGVRFIDLQSAYIDEQVEIGEGTVIGPCVTLEGNTVIGRDCVIRQNTRIKDARIADRVEIESSVILESSIGSGTTVVKQVPEKGKPIPKEGKVYLYTDDSVTGQTTKVPDFTGKSVTQAKQAAAQARLNIQLTGGGLDSSEARAWRRAPPCRRARWSTSPLSYKMISDRAGVPLKRDTLALSLFVPCARRKECDFP